MSGPQNTLPHLSLNSRGLRETLTKTFTSIMGMGPLPFPDDLVLKSVMGVGAISYDGGSKDQTILGSNDTQFLKLGLQGAREATLPLQFAGDFTVINRNYGDDFLDFAKGVKAGHADIILSCYVHHPMPPHHIHYHIEGAQHYLMMKHLDKPEVRHDVDNMRYYGISPHIPFEQDVGTLFADASNAVKARAIIVFGGENTVSVPQYAHGPYVYVGQIYKPEKGHKDYFPYEGHLLLHIDYLAELTAFAASRGIVYPLQKQPIPVELHPFYKPLRDGYVSNTDYAFVKSLHAELGWDPLTKTTASPYLPEAPFIK